MIHENGIELSEAERFRLKRNEMSQDRQIALLFMNRPGQGFTFYEVVQATGFNQDSAKRAISNMAGSQGSERYTDEYGRMPIVKTGDKRLNPDTGVKIHVYKWNNRYKKPPSHRELLEKHSGRQMHFHGNKKM